MNPTQRSRALYLDLGYLVETVERWIPGACIRKDAFGIGDLLAAHPVGGQIVLVQTTSLSNVASRIQKLEGNAAAIGWLRSGGEIHFHGWGKTGKAGERKLWTCRVVVARAAPGLKGYELRGLRNGVPGDLHPEQGAPSQDLLDHLSPEAAQQEVGE